MKALQINSVCGIGSTGRIATDIHEILIKQGHESYIAFGRGLPKKCDTAIRIGSKYDNYVHAALTRVLDRHGLGSKKATQEFINKVEKIDPDIIHLHNIHGYYINIEILFNYIKDANKPVVWTLHDCWSFTGHCSYFDYVNCDAWVDGCKNCQQKKDYPASFVFDNSQTNYLLKKQIFTGVKNLTIVTPSKWLAGLVKKSFLKDYPVQVINNGIDLDIFKPTSNNFRKKYKIHGKFIILGVANIWDRRKGLKYFHEIAKKIQGDEVIILVGLSEKQIKELPDNIIGITRTNNINELVDIYSEADVFLNPTLEDNFPTVNLESLACGTPVITFNSGGSPECVDEHTGVLVEKGSVDGLLHAVKIIKDMGKPFYSENTMRRAKDLYNKKERYKEYIRAYVNGAKE